MHHSSGNYEAFARPRKPQGVENKRINEVFGPEFLGSNFWLYWRTGRNAAKDPAFGRPDVFGARIPATKWESATVTTRDKRIPKYIAQIAKRDPFSGKLVAGGIVTAKDSAWLMSWTVSRQPHFKAQPKEQIVVWVGALLRESKLVGGN